MAFCGCSSTLGGTGVPNKQRVVSSGVGLIAVPLKADDGTLNQILAGDTIDQAYIDAKINEEDESKRWYPIGRIDFRNQEDTRADPITETFSDGGSAITQQGVRTYLGWLVDYAPAYIEQLNALRCRDFGLYTISECIDLTGSITKDGLALNPIRVNKSSWEPRYVKGTPTVSAKIQLAFEFSQIEKDEYLRVISGEEITADLLNLEGLLPLAATISGEALTGFVADLKVDFDIFLDASKEVVPGWVATDFALLNKTNNTVVAITSVTEAPDGTYTFVIPSQTSGDVLQLTNVKTSSNKPGFFLQQDITLP